MFKGLFARGGKADAPASTGSGGSGKTGNMGRNIQRSFARGVDCNSKPLAHTVPLSLGARETAHLPPTHPDTAPRGGTLASYLPRNYFVT